MRRRRTKAIELRGMFFDGEVYVGDDGVKAVSKLPTREEAIGLLVGLMLSPGANLSAAMKGPGGTLGAIIKAVELKGERCRSRRTRRSTGRLTKDVS